MKKRILLFAILITCIVAKTTCQTLDGCTQQESILLKERPPKITEREAFNVIKGKKEFIDFDSQTIAIKPQSIFPFVMEYKTYFKRLRIVRTNDATGMAWKEIQFEVAESSFKKHYGYYVWLVISFLFGLLTAVGLIVLHDDFFENTFNVFWVGLIVSLLLGGFIYTIYTGSGFDHLKRPVGFNFIELYGAIYLGTAMAIGGTINIFIFQKGKEQLASWVKKRYLQLQGI